MLKKKVEPFRPQKISETTGKLVNNDLTGEERAQQIEVSFKSESDMDKLRSTEIILVDGVEYIRRDFVHKMMVGFAENRSISFQVKKWVKRWF